MSMQPQLPFLARNGSSGKKSSTPLFREGTRLRLFTGATALVHLGGFILTLMINKDQTFPLYVRYMTWPAVKGEPFEFKEIRSVSLSLKWLISAFFLLSAFFQWLPATLLWEDTWKRLTEKGIQPYRWVEYSFSASCLVLVGAALDGINDLHFMLLIFATMWTVMFLGWIQENNCFYLRTIAQAAVVQPSVGRRRGGFMRWFEFLMPHLVGWVPYLFVWFALLHKFAVANDKSDQDAPKWVIGFYVFNFLVFSSFGFNQVAQMCRLRPWRTLDDQAFKRVVVFHETAYVVLSLVAKTVTAYFLFTGLLASSSVGSF
jgi:hypothetical protein